jgi:hypothetical protein
MLAARARVQRLELVALRKVGIPIEEGEMATAAKVEAVEVVEAPAVKPNGRAGELLIEMSKNGTRESQGRPEKTPQDAGFIPVKKLEDLGVTREQASVESPTNGHALAAGGGDLAELEALVDQHWKLLSLCDKVRALLNTYAGVV